MLIDFNYSLILLSGIIFILLAFYLKNKRKKTFGYLIFFGFFYLYIMLVINKTQFPIITDLDPHYYGLSNAFVYQPVNFITDLNRAIILNVILTIPFGFLLPFLKKVNFKTIALYGFLFTLSIEGCQLLVYLILGAHLRFIDINDVIYNSIGVILGYFLFKIFTIIFMRVLEKFKIEMNFLLAFIYSNSKKYISSK